MVMMIVETVFLFQEEEQLRDRVEWERQRMDLLLLPMLNPHSISLTSSSNIKYYDEIFSISRAISFQLINVNDNCK